jgi:DNA-binding transcriptional LysR family regulator
VTLDRLDQLDPPAAPGKLRAGELDLAVIFRFAAGDSADDPGERLAAMHLAHDPYALAVPGRSTLARRRRLEVADRADEDWCRAPLDSPATDIIRRSCREHGGFEPRLTYPTTTWPWPSRSSPRGSRWPSSLP